LLPAIPEAWVPAAMLAVAAVFLFMPAVRLVGLFLLALLLCMLAYQARLDDRLMPSLAGTVQDVQGVVVSIPRDHGDYLSFRFEPDKKPDKSMPNQLFVRWYRDWPEVRTGQRWQFELRLKPPWGIVNFQGPDRERWLFSERIGGYGSVREGALLAGKSVNRGNSVQETRARVLSAISRQVDDPRQRAVVQALAAADRSGLGEEDRRLLGITGTAHLLAISGLHIGLAALAGMLVFRGVARIVPLILPGRLLFYLLTLSGAATAAGYAILADLGVSTVRALVMLIATAMALSMSRSVHPFRAFLIALAAVLLANPFAPLGSGFWFSFFAVFALLWVFQPRSGSPGWLKTAVMAQAAVFLVLLPVNAIWLGGISLLAFPANLAAIPWVSFLVVPPVLAGVAVFSLAEPLAGALWSFAGLFIEALFRFLEMLGALQTRLVGVRAASLPFLVAAVSGALLLLLPRGIPMRWIGLFLVLPLFLPVAASVPKGGLRIDALDVGQGTAVAVSDPVRTLMYDTGPGDGAGFDLVSSAIAPLFTALGRSEPDYVILSHGDLDHTGGLRSVKERFSHSTFVGSVREGQSAVEKCHSGLHWEWGEIPLEILHPSQGLPYLRNNSSCVLAVGGARVGVLLPGDIENFVEERLLMEGLDSYRVMLAPHHGSTSSSSEAFIERVAPSVVIASAGLGNRFGFPRPEVRERYVSRGIDFWSTGGCGGIRLIIDGEGRISAASARNERRRIWRWPAEDSCP
jgi:competence protein ComEC